MKNEWTKNVDTLINQYAEEIEAKLIVWRRDIHEHPELGNQEFRTSKIVADHLRNIGVDEVYEERARSTGVFGFIHGSTEGPIIGLRADMDALPQQETTNLPFASKVTGQYGDLGTVPVMHACGHDNHVAILMATAEILVKMRSYIRGKVLLVFQPAEEGAASDFEGSSGALAVSEDEIYLKNKPTAMFALHVSTTGQIGNAGKIIFGKPGFASYGMSIMRLVLRGKGGHASVPWNLVDTNVMGAQVLLALQTIISRNVNVYTNRASLSVGAVRGGQKFNVLPDEFIMDGALRYTDPTARVYLEKRIEDTAQHISASMGGTSSVKWTRSPIIKNDPDLINKLFPRLQDIIGKNDVTISASEGLLDDFSWFAEKGVPSVFLILAGDPDEGNPEQIPFNHMPNFTIAERALLNGVKAMTALAIYGARFDH